MFLINEKNNFYCNRGDTFILPIAINCNNKLEPEIYKLSEDDNLYIGIREFNQPFEDSIIKKKLTSDNSLEDGSLNFILESSDTEYLRTGKYFIEMKLEQNIGERIIVTTVLPSTEFFLVGSDKLYYN